MKFAVNSKTKTKYFPLWVPFQHGANGNVNELWVVCKDSFCIAYRENCELDIIFTEMTDGETVSGKDLAVSFEFQELLAEVATENQEDPLAEMLTQYIKLDFPENGISKELDAEEIGRRKQLFVEWFDQMASQLSEGDCRYFFEGISEPFGGKNVLTASQQFQTTRFLNGTSYIYSGLCRQSQDGGMSFVSLAELIEGQCQQTEFVENADGNTLAKHLEIFCDYYADNKVHYIGSGKKRYGRRENVSVCRYIGKGASEVKIPQTYSGAPVYRIDEDAFRECDMEEVYLPYGVEIVGARAFEDCMNLKKIHLPMGLRQIDIETLPIGCVLVTVQESKYIKELCLGMQNVHKIGYELEDGTPICTEETIVSLEKELPPIEESVGVSNDLSALSEEISDLLEEVELALDKNDKKVEELEMLVMEEEVVEEPAAEDIVMGESVVEELEMPVVEEELAVEELEMPIVEEELAVEELEMPIVEEELAVEEKSLQDERVTNENLQNEVAALQDKLAELEAILQARSANTKESKDKISIQIPEVKIPEEVIEEADPQMEAEIQIPEVINVEETQMEAEIQIPEVVNVEETQMDVEIQIPEAVNVEETQMDVEIQIPEAVNVEETQMEAEIQIPEVVNVEETQMEAEIQIPEEMGEIVNEEDSTDDFELDMSDARVIYDNSPMEGMGASMEEQKDEEFVIPDIMPELFADAFGDEVIVQETIEDEVLIQGEEEKVEKEIVEVSEVDDLPSMEEMLAQLNEEMEELSVKELEKPDLIIEDIVSLDSMEEMKEELIVEEIMTQDKPELIIEEIIQTQVEDSVSNHIPEQLALSELAEEICAEAKGGFPIMEMEEAATVEAELTALVDEVLTEVSKSVPEIITEDVVSEIVEETFSDVTTENAVEAELTALVEDVLTEIENPTETEENPEESVVEEVLPEIVEETQIPETEENLEESVVEEVLPEIVEEVQIPIRKPCSLKLTIGEKGNSFIALNLPVEMLEQIGITIEDEETYPIMLLGNYIDCAIEEQIIKYNLLTKEMTRKTVDENVVSLLNRSVSRNAKVNEAFKNTCADFTTIMNAVLLGKHAILNDMLRKSDSILEIVEEDGCLRVKDPEGEIHSMQEALWIISQNS